MQSSDMVDRPNLTGVVVDRVRQAILNGKIPPESRINEVRLAGSLRVSRTPLREALMHLAAEGNVTVIPRRGFFVRSLEIEEFENLYSIRALLDPEALRLSGIPDATRLQRLEALNKKLLRATTPLQLIAVDNQWHLELVSGCPNRVLIDLIRQFMDRTRRYEMALLGEQKNAKIVAREHNEILVALRSHDLRRACAALRKNMESGREPIVRGLKERAQNK